MVKIPPFCTEGTGSVPGQGTKICYAAEKKSGGGGRAPQRIKLDFF